MMCREKWVEGLGVDQRGPDRLWFGVFSQPYFPLCYTGLAFLHASFIKIILEACWDFTAYICVVLTNLVSVCVERFGRLGMHASSQKNSMVAQIKRIRMVVSLIWVKLLFAS